MAINLYLIRHGIAVERTDDMENQPRPLTAKGIKKTQAVAQQLKLLGLHFSEILSSPLTRARQTAEILLKAGLSDQISMTETLAPMGSLADWLDWVRPHNRSGAETDLALVGHEPDLSQWAEVLLWGEAQGVIELKKAGIIGLRIPEDVDPIGNCGLFWLTPPKFLLLS